LAPYGPDMRDQNHPSVVLPLGYEPSEYIWCTLSGTRNSVDEVEKRGKKISTSADLPFPITLNGLSRYLIPTTFNKLQKE